MPASDGQDLPGFLLEPGPPTAEVPPVHPPSDTGAGPEFGIIQFPPRLFCSTNDSKGRNTDLSAGRVLAPAARILKLERVTDELPTSLPIKDTVKNGTADGSSAKFT